MDTIPLWPASAPGDPRTHFWCMFEGRCYRICDSEAWPDAEALVTATIDTFVPCVECRDTYVAELVKGEACSVVVLTADELECLCGDPGKSLLGSQ